MVDYWLGVWELSLNCLVIMNKKMAMSEQQPGGDGPAAATTGDVTKSTMTATAVATLESVGGGGWGVG